MLYSEVTIMACDRYYVEPYIKVNHILFYIYIGCIDYPPYLFF